MSREIDPDEPLEEGKTYQNVYDITVASWIPEYTGMDASEYLKSWILEPSFNYGGEVNDRIGNHDITVLDREVRQTGPHEFEYIVTYRVDHVDPNADDDLTAAGIPFMAVLIVLGIIGVGYALRETRLITEEAGTGGTLLIFGAAALVVREIGKARNPS